VAIAGGLGKGFVVRLGGAVAIAGVVIRQTIEIIIRQSIALLGTFLIDHRIDGDYDVDQEIDGGI
jgi:hypothetical protein